MNYGTVSRQQLAQLAATPSGLDGGTKPGRLFAVTCCSTTLFNPSHQCLLKRLDCIFVCRLLKPLPGCIVERQLTPLKSSLSHSGYFWQHFVMDLLSLHSRMRR